jgi:ribosomal protein L29
MKLKDLKNEIKVLDIAALMSRAKALKIEINDMVLDKNINRIKNLKTMSTKRKEMARVLTVLGQKKMIGKLEASDKSLESGEKAKKEKTEKKGAQA